VIDYEALLKKYMALVDYCEGTTFISSPSSYWAGGTPTAEELALLKRIEAELPDS
jgi:hypothetical protein